MSEQIGHVGWSPDFKSEEPSRDGLGRLAAKHMTVEGMQAEIVRLRRLEHGQEKIVAAAILLTNGIVLSVPRPGRHCDVIRSAVYAGVMEDLHREAARGFLTSEGRWVTRRQAWAIAHKAGQISDEVTRSVLTSEDLW